MQSGLEPQERAGERGGREEGREGSKQCELTEPIIPTAVEGRAGVVTKFPRSTLMHRASELLHLLVC